MVKSKIIINNKLQKKKLFKYFNIDFSNLNLPSFNTMLYEDFLSPNYIVEISYEDIAPKLSSKMKYDKIISFKIYEKIFGKKLIAYVSIKSSDCFQHVFKSSLNEFWVEVRSNIAKEFIQMQDLRCRIINPNMLKYHDGFENIITNMKYFTFKYTQFDQAHWIIGNIKV
jgi:hypothetical protein